MLKLSCVFCAKLFLCHHVAYGAVKPQHPHNTTQQLLLQTETG